jgi:hypothetical protein
VTFTNSKYFCIGAGGRVFTWVMRGQRAPHLPKHLPKESPRVHVYAAVNCHGVSSPIILNKQEMKVTAEGYVSKVLPVL